MHRNPRTSKWTTFLALGSLLAAAGCSADDPKYVDDLPPDGTYIEISGTIEEDTTWSGRVHLLGDARVPDGVTLTMAAGTELRGVKDAILRVEGKLVVAGTPDEPVTMYPLGGSPSWGGFTAEEGGEIDLAYVIGADVSTLVFCNSGAIQCRLRAVDLRDFGYALITAAPSSIERSILVNMANGGITTRAGSDLTITDSYILTSSGDLIISQPGSRLTIEYSEIGGAQGSYEHCNLHINGADHLSIKYSNIISGVYGFMIGGTSDGEIQYNNITENGSDVLDLGGNRNLDMRYNHWDKGAPSNLGADYDTSSPAAYIESAGPRL